MNILSRLQEILAENRAAIENTFKDGNLNVLEQIAGEMVRVLENRGTIFLCGNGGSAADAQHIAAEFIGRFKHERRSLPAIALTTDTSILTALANDYSYDVVFARQIEGLGKAGDLLIAISTSGNSTNVIEAVKAAKELGVKTAAFTGETGGKLAGMTDYIFKARSKNTSHVQETHITALHAVSEIVEEIFTAHALKS
ncbi:MAG: SIS domain-containing protein [Candidatus Omnitrophica bacterium]|nr:SIS domain-containing protein [Candidatus Omnitrophota bacterium]